MNNQSKNSWIKGMLHKHVGAKTSHTITVVPAGCKSKEASYIEEKAASAVSENVYVTLYSRGSGVFRGRREKDSTAGSL